MRRADYLKGVAVSIGSDGVVRKVRLNGIEFTWDDCNLYKLLDAFFERRAQPCIIELI